MIAKAREFQRAGRVVPGWARAEHRAWWCMGVVRRRGRSALTRPVARLGDASWVMQRGLPPEDVARALSLALREGALESAAALTEELLPVLETLPSKLRRRSRENVLETLLAHGARERAGLLAAGWRGDLRQSVVGVGLLEVLQQGRNDTWLPDARANLLALARDVSAQELDGSGLARAIASRPWTWVTQPELHLLACGANLKKRPALAFAHLNRFLGVHGAPRALPSPIRSGEAGLLGSLCWESSRSVNAGPLVSVIIAVRNAAATVGYAVRSLLEQSYRALEILICDDASDDATPRLLRELQQQDVRVRLFRSEKQQGTYNVRNALIERARGSLVTFHDADDLALPHRISLQVSVMAQSRAAACVGSCLRIKADDSFVFFKDQRATRLAPVSMMLRRELFRACGPFRAARVGADLELYSALREHPVGGMVRVRTPLLLARWTNGSVTRQPGTEALEDGYRAPARRAYSELLFVKYGARRDVAAEAWEQMLVSHGNYVAPAPVLEK